MGKRIRIGVSRCLLGENVRYDGSDRRDAWVADVLASHARLVPVCPEVECGLGVPRERMQLEGDPAAPRLLTTFSRLDHTDRMVGWARRRAEELAAAGLCGFILKAKSPSCGVRGVPVRTAPGRRRRGKGLFAAALAERLPFLPVIEERQLAEEALRENFLTRAFVLGRWQVKVGRGGTCRDLERFHAEHRLLVMAHSPRRLRALERVLATRRGFRGLSEEYLAGLMDALRLRATPRKHCVVLRRLASRLAGPHRRRALALIERYRRGEVSRGVAVAFIGECLGRRNVRLLGAERYFRPFPPSLQVAQGSS